MDTGNKWFELKSDYFRIEIKILRKSLKSVKRLKSDYFRIEILTGNSPQQNSRMLKSDYFRIEISIITVTKVN